MENYQRPYRKLVNKKFELLKANPYHPSLQLKNIENYHSVRVGLKYRALAVEVTGGLLWFWIGSHSDYDKLIN